jgi:translation initiation factor 1
MKREKKTAPAPAGPFHDAFAKLRERLPEGIAPRPQSATGKDAGAPAPPARAPARAVVSLERKGRGGKEATLVLKLALPPTELARWADALKRALGCGGGVEGDAIVVQGDQRERVMKWLEGRGVARVIRGS